MIFDTGQIFSPDPDSPSGLATDVYEISPSDQSQRVACVETFKMTYRTSPYDHFRRFSPDFHFLSIPTLLADGLLKIEKSTAKTALQ